MSKAASSGKIPGERSSPKRDHLVRTAWNLFYRNGYHAVGIDAVLADAGVAKMTLYNHFDSKEDLIVAALEATAKELDGQLLAAVQAAGTDPLARLRAVFGWLEVWVREPGFSGCAYMKAAGEYGASADKPRLVAVEVKERLRIQLAALTTEAGLLEPERLARQLMLLIDGAVMHAHLHKRPDYAVEAREAAEALIAAAQK